MNACISVNLLSKDFHTARRPSVALIWVDIKKFLRSAHLTALAVTRIGEEVCHYDEHSKVPYSPLANSRPFTGFHALLTIVY